MHLYEISASGHSSISVFAESYGKAVDLFVSWWMLRQNSDLPDLEVRQRNPSWTGLNTEHLQDALARGVTGIGRYEVSMGWTILPPDVVLKEDT